MFQFTFTVSFRYKMPGFVTLNDTLHHIFDSMSTLSELDVKYVLLVQQFDVKWRAISKTGSKKTQNCAVIGWEFALGYVTCKYYGILQLGWLVRTLLAPKLNIAQAVIGFVV